VLWPSPNRLNPPPPPTLQVYGCRTQTFTLHGVTEARVVRVESTGADVIDVNMHVGGRVCGAPL
jgi:hypothetical protein